MEETPGMGDGWWVTDTKLTGTSVAYVVDGLESIRRDGVKIFNCETPRHHGRRTIVNCVEYVNPWVTFDHVVEQDGEEIYFYSSNPVVPIRHLR